MKSEWNPEHYLKFNTQRIKPSIDLVRNIEIEDPKSILDIGCGPGNSSSILETKYPNSKIIGIDNSETMIARAKKDYPNIEFLLMDAAQLSFDYEFDIIFSNATIQWISNQEALFLSISKHLSDKGLFACQVPLFWEMPVGKLLEEIATSESLKDLLADVNSDLTIYSVNKYYDILSSIFGTVNIWQTDYVHIMPNQDAIYTMLETTGFRPFLSKLNVEIEKEYFITKIKEGIKTLYPTQRNGNVLFPFKRLFFTVKN